MMVLHVHKEKTDALKLVNVANEFVFGSEHRLKQFGKFTDIDLRRKDVPVKSCGVYVNIQKQIIFNIFNIALISIVLL